MRVVFVRALVLALILTVMPSAPSISVVTIPEVVRTDVDISVAAAQASPARTGARAVTGGRSAPIAAPMPFTMVGFELPDGVDTVRVRTADDDGVWGDWAELERVERDEGPDHGTAEAANDRSRQYTEPIFVGAATRLQVEAPADLDRDVEFRASLLDTDGLSGGPVTRRSVRVGGPLAEASTRAPAIVTRAAWGAAPPKGSASYASRVDMTVVHHTAGNNNYTREQAAGIVRGIQRWHMDNNGWSDVGYNVLVDRFGTIYEGRAGGLERAVIGAHAAGFNSASFGVTVIGNFVNVDAPQAAYDALVRIIAWKSSIHGMDPLGTTERVARGVKLRTVSGHRDMGSTACPGLIANRLGWIRQEAAKNTTQPAGGSTPPPAAPPPAEAGRFPDVTSSTHRDNVLTVHDVNVLLGYQDNTFKPANPLNRGDMARAVARSMGLKPAPWDNRFSDVPNGHWLAPWVIALNNAGVVGGYPDGTFRMAEPLRRDQMATFLARSLKLAPAQPTFTDVPRSSTHAQWIGAVQRHNVTNGITATEFGPGLTMRRDQSATMLVRAYKLRR